MDADEYTLLCRAQAQVLKAKLGAETHGCCIDIGIELAISATLSLLFTEEVKE